MLVDHFDLHLVPNCKISLPFQKFLFSLIFQPGLLLQPGECRLRGNKRFVDVWAGGFATIARCLSTNVIYACGLNNYGQLALIKQESVDIKEKMEVDDEPPNSKEKERLSETMLAKTQGPLIQYMLTPANGFDSEKDWTQFAIGMHHTLALTASGKCCSFVVHKIFTNVNGLPFSRRRCIRRWPM